MNTDLTRLREHLRKGHKNIFLKELQDPVCLEVVKRSLSSFIGWLWGSPCLSPKEQGVMLEALLSHPPITEHLKNRPHAARAMIDGTRCTSVNDFELQRIFFEHAGIDGESYCFWLKTMQSFPRVALMLQCLDHVFAKTQNEDISAWTIKHHDKHPHLNMLCPRIALHAQRITKTQCSRLVDVQEKIWREPHLPQANWKDFLPPRVNQSTIEHVCHVIFSHPCVAERMEGVWSMLTYVSPKQRWKNVEKLEMAKHLVRNKDVALFSVMVEDALKVSPKHVAHLLSPWCFQSSAFGCLEDNAPDILHQAIERAPNVDWEPFASRSFQQEHKAHVEKKALLAHVATPTHKRKPKM